MSTGVTGSGDADRLDREPVRKRSRQAFAADELLTRARRCMPSIAVVALALIFRLPVLLNAGALDSDGATAGLQAVHMLRGEWSWILWGAPYQAPGDSLLAAGMFSLLGARPLALVLVPALGQAAVAWLVFATLRRAFAPWPAVWLAMPVVLTPVAVNWCLFAVQRQFCITVFMTAIWLLDGARDSSRPAFRLVVGAWLGVLTIYLDLFALEWVPPLALFALASATHPDPGLKSRPMWIRISAAAGGLVAGALSVRTLRSFCPPASGQVSLSMDHLSHNSDLLWNQALPWALGVKVFASRGHLYPDLLAFPGWFEVVQRAAAVLILLGMASAAVLFWVRRIPWRVRLLGLFAIATIASSVGGYLVSGMPADMWSTRYLGPIILVMPFALSPVAWLLRSGRFALVSAPYLLTSAVNGWLSYGINCVDGFLPIRSARGTASEEQQVAQLLREHKVAFAAAQYWLSYRLTFLFREDPIVVPLAPGEDRYPPYRRGFNTARDVAYVFHPSEPRARPQDVEAQLVRAGEPYERYSIADFTVLIEHRPRR